MQQKNNIFTYSFGIRGLLTLNWQRKIHFLPLSHSPLPYAILSKYPILTLRNIKYCDFEPVCC